MQITPLGDIIQLEIEETKAGALDTSGRDSAVEYAKVIAVSGANNYKENEIKVGDHVFVKAWAIDIINHDGKKYYFVNPSTGGILAKVQ